MALTSGVAPSSFGCVVIYDADYDEKVLPSIVNEVAKQVVAQFTAAELIYQREHVSRLIAQRLVRAIVFSQWGSKQQLVAMLKMQELWC